MNKTPDARRAMILRCLTEGMSVRATSRLTGAAVTTILRILKEAGEFAEGFQYHRIRGLATTHVEADEQWSFVGAKQRNAKTVGQGDIWTFAALDADSKLVICWLVGARSPENTSDFIADLATRVANRIQLTTDGFGAYLGAVRRAFDFARCDFAQLLKLFGQSHEEGPARRYSPPVVVETKPIRRIGRPDPDRVSTSYVERLNLNTRQNCRRFTRLTNAFSKKAENHANAVALEFFAHNWIRPHGTLTKAAGRKTTPAMAAGLTDRVWTWEEVAGMMDEARVLG